MILFLDTNAYADWCSEGRWHEEIGLADRILLTPTVLGEIDVGFRGGAHRGENEKRLFEFLAEPQVKIPALTHRTAQIYGELYHVLKRAGTPIPTNDLWIAAACVEQGAILLTRDRHFQRLPGLQVQFADW